MYLDFIHKSVTKELKRKGSDLRSFVHYLKFFYWIANKVGTYTVDSDHILITISPVLWYDKRSFTSSSQCSGNIHLN